jgi:DNA ligase-1
MQPPSLCGAKTMGARMPTSRRQFLASLLGCALFPHVARARDAAAPPLLLANVADANVDPADYLVSEKYDGVRAVWDGRLLRFRSGRTVSAPHWFIERLPARPLDGELWLARGQFDALSGIVRKSQPVDDEWRQLRYMVFELPAADGSFAQRHAQLQHIAQAANWQALRAVEQSHVADRQALLRMLDAVHGAGGEGLMLHRADAPYATGRSDVLLKLKPLADSEAQVVAHVAGQGKYAGMMGALVVRTPAGQHFRIGSGFSDAVRREPPPLGSTITYTYRDLTASGLPRFASYLRMADPL